LEKNYLGYAPWISLGLLFLNLVLGGYLWHDRSENQSLQQAVTLLQSKFAEEEAKLAAWRKSTNNKQNQSVSLHLTPLLERLQRIVPDGLRFEKLIINPEIQEVELTGISFSQISLDSFLKKISTLAKVKFFKSFETKQTVRNSLNCVDFRLKMLLEGNEDDSSKR